MIEETPHLIAHRASLKAWRAQAFEDQLAYFQGSPPRGGFTRKSNDGRVRVGLLCPCLVMGGAEAQQLTIGRYADPAKIDFRGCCVVNATAPIDPGMMEATSELMPVSVGLDAARRLAAECDILITWAIPDLPVILAGVAGRPRIVSVMHAPIESGWAREVYRTSRGIDQWVAVSELALEAMPAGAGIVPVRVIWNAVDLGRLEVRRDRATMRRLWGISEDVPVAGYLGRLSSEKDPLAMIRLAQALPEPWRIVVVGAGFERLDLVKPDNVTLAGNDPAAGDVLNGFDVLVVPSHYESFGLTIAEGLHANKPMVTTRSGLAKIAPGITHEVPVNADGPTLALAVQAALANGPKPKAQTIVAKLEPTRFGAEWTELLCSMAPPVAPPKPTIDPAVRDRVNACTDRGGELAVSAYVLEGCCSGPTRWECRAGKRKSTRTADAGRVLGMQELNSAGRDNRLAGGDDRDTGVSRDVRLVQSDEAAADLQEKQRVSALHALPDVDPANHPLGSGDLEILGRFVIGNHNRRTDQ